MDDDNLDSKSSTILDALNEDCWRLILDQLHITDILQSETVSQQWQQNIYQYLQGSRFSIEYPNYKDIAPNHFRCLLMSEDDPDSLARIIRKWGRFVRKLDCVDKVVRRDTLKNLGKHCPNLEDVTFYRMKDDVLLHKRPKHFRQLKRLNFNKCKYVTDECVRLWLTDVTELTLQENKFVTGLCLTNLRSNLKTLSLKKCKALESRYLLSIAHRLTELRKLELYFLPNDVFQNAHHLLDKMTKLEDLTLGWFVRIDLGRELVDSISRLDGLRRVDLSFNMNASDEWLEVIARNCRLEELLVERCLDVTGRGVLAVCRASGPRMRTLHVGSNQSIHNRDVVAFITACPNLTWVDVSYDHSVSEALVAEAAAVRARALRLGVEGTVIEGHSAELYPWLELDFGPSGIQDNDSVSS